MNFLVSILTIRERTVTRKKLTVTDGRNDPDYRKASPLKTQTPS